MYLFIKRIVHALINGLIFFCSKGFNMFLVNMFIPSYFGQVLVTYF